MSDATAAARETPLIAAGIDSFAAWAANDTPHNASTLALWLESCP